MTLAPKNYRKQIIFKESVQFYRFHQFKHTTQSLVNLNDDLITVAQLCMKAYQKYTINIKATNIILYSLNAKSLQKWSLLNFLAH